MSAIQGPTRLRPPSTTLRDPLTRRQAARHFRAFVQPPFGTRQRGIFDNPHRLVSLSATYSTRGRDQALGSGFLGRVYLEAAVAVTTFQRWQPFQIFSTRDNQHRDDMCAASWQPTPSNHGLDKTFTGQPFFNNPSHHFISL